jgi:hypothetical protein
MSFHSNYIRGKDGYPSMTLVLETVQILLLRDWLDMQELSVLDMAMSDHSMRMKWLNMLKADGSQAANK